jgi:hypothetical protein
MALDISRTLVSEFQTSSIRRNQRGESRSTATLSPGCGS